MSAESRVITEIWWEPGQGFDPRASTVLSDPAKIRLDPEDFRIKLKLQATGRYPTDADLSARSRTYRPEAVAQLLMIQLNARTPRDEDGNAVTSVRLRLFDGTDERFWGGASWDVAGPGDWNTEDEVNQNIASFDVSDRAFAVVLNLVTTDDRYTPEVESVFVLWRGLVDWTQDALLDSLTATVQEEALFPADFALPPLEADSASIDLDSYEDEAALEVVDVEAVWDHDADPLHRTDLLSAYNPGTRVVTLSAAIPAGNRPYLRLSCRASVAWDTGQDFEEVGRLPQVVLRDAEAVSSSPYPFRSASGIVRKDTKEAVKVPAPYRMTYNVTMEVRTDRSREQARVMDALTRLLAVGPASEVGPFLRSRATDRRFRLWLVEEFRAEAPDLKLADVRSYRAEFRVVDVALNLRPAVDTFGITALKLGFSAVTSEEEQAARLSDAPERTTEVETVEVTQ
jgi:hypothetical protein